MTHSLMGARRPDASKHCLHVINELKVTGDL